MEADEIFLADFGLFLLDLLLSNIKYQIKACQNKKYILQTKFINLKSHFAGHLNLGSVLWAFCRRPW